MQCTALTTRGQSQLVEQAAELKTMRTVSNGDNFAGQIQIGYSN